MSSPPKPEQIKGTLPFPTALYVPRKCEISVCMFVGSSMLLGRCMDVGSELGGVLLRGARCSGLVRLFPAVSLKFIPRRNILHSRTRFHPQFQNLTPKHRVGYVLQSPVGNSLRCVMCVLHMDTVCARASICRFSALVSDSLRS